MEAGLVSSYDLAELVFLGQRLTCPPVMPMQTNRCWGEGNLFTTALTEVYTYEANAKRRAYRRVSIVQEGDYAPEVLAEMETEAAVSDRGGPHHSANGRNLLLALVSGQS